MFKRFNPDLQKRNIELRDERLQNYQAFLDDLKEYSKSDKPIWVAAAEAEAQKKAQRERGESEAKVLQQRMREEMRAEAQGK